MNKVFQYRTKIIIFFVTTLCSMTLFLLPKLPAQFFRDAQTISLLMDNLNKTPIANLNITFPSSFVYSAAVYRFFGFSYLSTEIQSFIIFFLANSIILLTIYNSRITILSYIFLLISIVPLFVFQSQLTKELFVLPLIFFFTKSFTSKSKSRKMISVILFLTYFTCFALSIRSYWIITICFYCFFRVYYSFFPSHFLIFPIVLMCLICALSSNIVLHRYITDFRVQLNVGRDIVETSSIINNFVSNTSIYSDFFNMITISLKFLFPFLFLNFQKIYIILYTTIWSIFHLLIFWKWRYKFKSNSVCRHLFYLLVSFLVTQAIFEGDLGSVVKHGTGVIAIYVILLSEKKTSRAS